MLEKASRASHECKATCGQANKWSSQPRARQEPALLGCKPPNSPGAVIRWGYLLREAMVARCSALLRRDRVSAALGQADSHPK